MVNEVEASRFLCVLSRRRRLTEFDSAHALNSAARLLATDPSRPRPGGRGVRVTVEVPASFAEDRGSSPLAAPRSQLP